ncbi:MAG: FG-GAP-like repeat-containing protein [Wenzhouxiangellaceae bacterium]
MNECSWRRILAALVFLLLAVGAYAGDRAGTRFADGASAFYSGLAALEMGLFERAEADFDRAAKLLPEEPAIEVNLGVLAMRRGDDSRARELFSSAGSLAPRNADVALLIGLLERRAGNTEAAIESLRRAVRLAPEALKPRYALATVMAQSAPEKSRDAVREIIAGLVDDAPENLALRLEHVRILAAAGDREALAAAVARLAAMSDGWPEAAAAQLDTLKTLVDEPAQAVVRATMLRNVLLRSEDYRDSLARIQVPAQAGGEPIGRLLRAPAPASKPASPDTALAFEPGPVDAAAAANAGILVLDAGGPGAILQTALRTDHENDRENDREIGREIGREEPPGRARVSLTGVGEVLESSQTLMVDLDNDGRFELVVASGSDVRLFRRDATGDFAVADPESEHVLAHGSYTGAWAADLELDGDMDLVLGVVEGAPVVLQNNGDGTFTRRDSFGSVSGLRGFVWADIDGDGLPDVAALDSNGDVHVFGNDRAGTWTPNDVMNGHYLALAAADLDWDGRIDLALLAADGSLAVVNNGRARSIGAWSGIPADVVPGRAGLFAADFDNNGAPDLLASAGDRSHVWLASADGDLRPLESEPPLRTAAVVDLNGDGRLDLVGLDASGRAVEAIGSGVQDYGWQVLRPRALDNAGDNRINTYGLGGQVEVRSGLVVQRRVIDGPELHFGLGEREGVDVAWILWPNGSNQAEFDLAPRRTIEAVQRLKGSCPWLFTNDGEGMRFVTDFLWRSPLGMRINAVDTATITQTEDRVRIPGDALARLDGAYELRITAELWETHFMDGVALLAVDHAPSTAMFIDERFARAAPSLAPMITTEPRPVSAVVDQDGRDWTEAAREVDGRYVAGLELARYQGLTRPHHAEIELPGFGPVEKGVLLATGWIYPTDSSINVAVAQGESERPDSLRLEVPDGKGGWKVARADLGFPAGKHKTMVIDLEGLFEPGQPRRLRLATNLEIYWDRLAVADRVANPQGSARDLEMTMAELRYRGFSETRAPSRAQPEEPIYDRLQGTGQRWPDLAGYHTRFGDVRELLSGPDDRYVIMNAGDEIVLRFSGPPPSEGLVRDFVLVGHGWVKDGDYNTAFSRTVLPLPTHASGQYETPPTTLEDDPVYQRHREDWQRFHIRYVEPSDFLSGLRRP